MKKPADGSTADDIANVNVSSRALKNFTKIIRAISYPANLVALKCVIKTKLETYK